MQVRPFLSSRTFRLLVVFFGITCWVGPSYADLLPPPRRKPTTQKAQPKQTQYLTTPRGTAQALIQAIQAKDVKTFVALWLSRESRGKEKRLAMLITRFHKPMTILAKGMAEALKKKEPFVKGKTSVYKLPTLYLPYTGISRNGKPKQAQLLLVKEGKEWKVADID
ncbi:MAG: hypothetical protein EP343_11860 [Deltaproteobacteria bacterium]|nr:MAG: hypothetical protein EP343_11860 [Deltaproteobacteria bacterium]